MLLATMVKLPKRCGVLNGNKLKLALFNKEKKNRSGSTSLLSKGLSLMEVSLDSSKLA